jgi:hypothetical protein
MTNGIFALNVHLVGADSVQFLNRKAPANRQLQPQNADGRQLIFAPGDQSLGDLACEARSDVVVSIAEAVGTRSGTGRGSRGFSLPPRREHGIPKVGA